MLSALTNNVVERSVQRSTSIQTLIILVLRLPVKRTMPLLHLFCYISVTAAQNVGNRGTRQDRAWIRPIALANALRSMLLCCGVMAGKCLVSIERGKV